jgi:uncharacterized protein (TIGR00251 family)
MARSGSDREAAIRSDGGALLIRVWAHPGSDRDSIEGIDRFRRALNVRVRARAVEGEATAGVLSIISDRLCCKVVLEAGASSRQKLLRAFTDISPDEAAERLLGESYNKFKRKD